MKVYAVASKINEYSFNFNIVTTYSLKFNRLLNTLSFSHIIIHSPLVTVPNYGWKISHGKRQSLRGILMVLTMYNSPKMHLPNMISNSQWQHALILDHESKSQCQYPLFKPLIPNPKPLIGRCGFKTQFKNWTTRNRREAEVEVTVGDMIFMDGRQLSWLSQS